MQKLLSFIVLSFSAVALVSCGTSQPAEPAEGSDEAIMARCDRYVAYLECSLEKLETEEEKATARGIIDQVEEVINAGNIQKANQVCESAMNTLSQNVELAEKNGCTL